MRKLLIFVLILFSISIYAQSERNPVVEFCTGTWWSFCPSAEVFIHNNVLPNIPNAIILAYHGGNDPFASFPGNTILGLHGLSGYPTGIVDRVSGIQSYNPWYPEMLDRLDIPASVDIRIEANYNDSLRLLSRRRFEFQRAWTVSIHIEH